MFLIFQEDFILKKNDFTIIEIKHEDNIELNSFLEIDDDIEAPNPNSTYNNKDAYTLHFPLGYKASFDYENFKIDKSRPQNIPQMFHR